MKLQKSGEEKIKLQELFSDKYTVKIFKKGRMRLTGQAMRNQIFLLRAILKQSHVGKDLWKDQY